MWTFIFQSSTIHSKSNFHSISNMWTFWFWMNLNYKMKLKNVSLRDWNWIKIKFEYSKSPITLIKNSILYFLQVHLLSLPNFPLIWKWILDFWVTFFRVWGMVEITVKLSNFKHLPNRTEPNRMNWISCIQVTKMKNFFAVDFLKKNNQKIRKTRTNSMEFGSTRFGQARNFIWVR